MQVRWRLGLVGFAAQLPVAGLCPAIADRWRPWVVAALAVRLVVLAVLGPRGKRPHRILIPFAILDLAIVHFAFGSRYPLAGHQPLLPGDPGSFSIYYYSLTYLWAGCLTLRKSRLSSSWPWIPAAFLAAEPIAPESIARALGLYGFNFVLVVWATSSVNAFLRRSEEDVQDAANKPGVAGSVAHRLTQAFSGASRHRRDCNVPPHSDDTLKPIYDELFLLVRRRSLSRQFTEWRARDVRSESSQIREPDLERIADWIDVELATEPSPLSLRLSVPESADHIQLATKAAHSGLSNRDLPDLHATPDRIVNTGFGRVATLNIPLVKLGEGEGNPYLNDIIGGGVAGDNYRFGRALLWIMTLHPIALTIQQVTLAKPPGRADHSPWWLGAGVYAWLTAAGFVAVASVRRKEAVTTRPSWLWSIFTAYAVGVLTFAGLDQTGTFWLNDAQHWRFLHPFFGYGLCLTLLMSIWLAHTPQGFKTQLRIGDPGLVIRLRTSSERTSLQALAPLVPLLAAVAVAGARTNRFTLEAFGTQALLWSAPLIATALFGILFVRRFFLCIQEEAFAFSTSHIGDNLTEHLIAGCRPECEIRRDATDLARSWPDKQSHVPLAAALIGRRQSDNESHALTVRVDPGQPLRGRLGLLDRVLLVEGHQPGQLLPSTDGPLRVAFGRRIDGPLVRAVRYVLIGPSSWVSERTRHLEGSRQK